MNLKPIHVEIDHHTIKLIIGLIAFGIAWLVASRIIPVITHSDDRLSLSPFKSYDKMTGFAE